MHYLFCVINDSTVYGIKFPYTIHSKKKKVWLLFCLLWQPKNMFFFFLNNSMMFLSESLPSRCPGSSLSEPLNEVCEPHWTSGTSEITRIDYSISPSFQKNPLYQRVHVALGPFWNITRSGHFLPRTLKRFEVCEGSSNVKPLKLLLKADWLMVAIKAGSPVMYTQA